MPSLHEVCRLIKEVPTWPVVLLHQQAGGGHVQLVPVLEQVHLHGLWRGLQSVERVGHPLAGAHRLRLEGHWPEPVHAWTELRRDSENVDKIHGSACPQVQNQVAKVQLCEQPGRRRTTGVHGFSESARLLRGSHWSSLPHCAAGVTSFIASQFATQPLEPGSVFTAPLQNQD